MTIDTWVALPTLVTLFTGFYGLSRRDSTRLREEMRSEFAALRGELRREVRWLDDKVERLDDRIYGLAVRLQPALDAPSGGIRPADPLTWQQGRLRAALLRRLVSC